MSDDTKKLVPPGEVVVYVLPDGTLEIRWEWAPGSVSIYEGKFRSYERRDIPDGL